MSVRTSPSSRTSRMAWASAVSESSDTRQAAMEAASQVALSLAGKPPDLAFVFFSSHHRGDAGAIATACAEALLPRNLVGCSAGGVIGDGREVEERAGLSILAARLPGVEVRSFALEDDDLPDEDESPHAWEEALGFRAKGTPHFVVLTDPFSFDAEALLRGLDYAFPRGTKTGGLASAAERPGQNVLLTGNDVRRSGSVGVALEGSLAVDTIVAQGCRPIGSPLRITRVRDNELLGLEGHSPLRILSELLPTLPQEDQLLAQTSLFVGIGADSSADIIEPGDYLIRNLLGVRMETGSLAIGDRPREGQILQFHVRDAHSSSEDLDRQLARHSGSAPTGALLFSCLGRGMHLYGHANHDTDRFRERIGEVPLGGFFCNGEIGQVRGRSHIHGFTSSFALFRPHA